MNPFEISPSAILPTSLAFYSVSNEDPPVYHLTTTQLNHSTEVPIFNLSGDQPHLPNYGNTLGGALYPELNENVASFPSYSELLPPPAPVVSPFNPLATWPWMCPQANPTVQTATSGGQQRTRPLLGQVVAPRREKPIFNPHQTTERNGATGTVTNPIVMESSDSDSSQGSMHRRCQQNDSFEDQQEIADKFLSMCSFLPAESNENSSFGKTKDRRCRKAEHDYTYCESQMFKIIKLIPDLPLRHRIVQLSKPNQLLAMTRLCRIKGWDPLNPARWMNDPRFF